MTVISRILILSTMLLSATALPATPCSTKNAAGMHLKNCHSTLNHIESTRDENPTMAELIERCLECPKCCDGMDLSDDELLYPPAVSDLGPVIPEIIDSTQTKAIEVLAILEQRTSDGEFFNCGKQRCVTPSMCCGAETGCFPPQTGCPAGTKITGPPSMLDFVLAPKPTKAPMICDTAGYCLPNEE